MKHTPGPWVIDYEGTVGHIKAFVRDKTPTVCKYGTDYRGERHSARELEHQDAANARLIAAAPDMLQGLRAAILQIRELKSSIRHSHMCMAPQAFPCSCDANRLNENAERSIEAIRGIITRAEKGGE